MYIGFQPPSIDDISDVAEYFKNHSYRQFMEWLQCRKQYEPIEKHRQYVRQVIECLVKADEVHTYKLAEMAHIYLKTL